MLLALKGLLIETVIYGGIFALLASMAGSLLFGRSWPVVTSRMSAGLWRFLARTIVVVAMCVLNTAVLGVRLVYALVSRNDVQQRVVDAFTAYVERMADLVFGM